MDINDIKKKIKNIKKKFIFLKKITKFNKIKKKIQKIKQIFNKNIWTNYKYSLKITNKYLFLKKSFKKINNFDTKIKKINQYLKEKPHNIIKNKNNIKNIKKIYSDLKKLNLKFLLNKKHDIKNCYIEIKPGSGGIDAQDWSYILYKMYKKWAKKKKYKIKTLNIIYAETAGIKSATILICGKYAYGYLKNESGIHRLIRYSPFNANKKKHTSFCSISVYPEINKIKKIKIIPSEIKIDVYKASGAGGQHINKTESAVRITHIPTKITTQCQNSRSQHKNKKQAIKQIISKLDTLLNKKNKKNKTFTQKQIRSYFFNIPKIKDHILKLDISNINYILHGNIDVFIKKNLIKKYQKNEKDNIYI